MPKTWRNMKLGFYIQPRMCIKAAVPPPQGELNPRIVTLFAGEGLV